MQDNDATHACITLNEQQSDGYNQLDWLKTQGLKNQRSLHSVVDLRWSDGLEKNIVLASAGDHAIKRYSVPESKAKYWLKHLK